jgi:putative DNA primase/helicase
MPRDDTAERVHFPRPVVKIEAGMLDVIATEAERAIIAAGLPIYQRGRSLVRPAMQEVAVSHGRRTIAACFSEMTQPSALDYLSRAADWTRFDGRLKADVPINPPRQIADVLLSRFGDWKFPTVSGIVTTPTLRPDHSILCEPGYDPATRLYLVADPTLVLPAIPTFPTRGEAAAALQLLDDLLTGFPFVAAIDRSVALSALLTPICRGAMSVAPLHAFRANAAGTGKSYLCDLASALATGRPCPVVAAGNDSDETDKRLVGLLLAGFPMVSIDNLNGELGSDLLCQAVERPLIRLRRLGGSDISELETRATLFANGNALRVRGDMTRRTVVCDRDAEEERPELRTFAFDPVEQVLADRGRYVAAALTVVRAFVVSNEKPGLAPLASYADYSATVRGALVWLDKPDPVLSMEGARDDDPELGELREVMTQWQQHIGLNIETPAKALIHLADLHKHDDETGRQLPDYANPDLRDTLLAVAHGRVGIDAGRFGKWLRAKKGRVVTLQLPPYQRARVRFEARGLTQGVARWCLASFSAKRG